jgi:hypothetical protein
MAQEPRFGDAPGMAKHESLRELEHEAEIGESGRTPLILFFDVGVVTGSIVLLGIAIALFVYHFA